VFICQLCLAASCALRAAAPRLLAACALYALYVCVQHQSWVGPYQVARDVVDSFGSSHKTHQINHAFIWMDSELTFLQSHGINEVRVQPQSWRGTGACHGSASLAAWC
jgi:hypothetical protein